MYPEPYIDYLAHFHGDRDYFECHEILEEYWKEQDKGNKNSIWVAFIQLAVGSYHYRRGNMAGALKTLQKALAIFQDNGDVVQALGVDKEVLLMRIRGLLEGIQSGSKYKSIEIPILDRKLKEKITETSQKKGMVLSKACSHSPSPDIVDRHKVRDRASVISERVKAIELKKRKRGR